MKVEDRATPTPAPVTPAQFPATNTWGSQIPIDPALQQQSQPQPATTYYQQYTHYPATSYNTNYQHQYPIPNPQTPVPAPALRQNAPTSSLDTADVATLNDALASGGVDLRAEEESLHRPYDQHQPYRAWEDRTRKQPPTPNFSVHFIGSTMRSIGSQHKVTKIPEDSVNYIALAVRARLQDLITAMIAASAHRTDAQFDRPASLYPDNSPMWSIVIRSDVQKQLAALEKVEREEEQRVRRERKEREDMAASQAAALAAQTTGMGDGLDEDGQPKKKKKKEGPGVTARNMSEDVRKKMSNAAASHAAGLSTNKYAWMTAGNANAPTPPKKATPSGASASAPAPVATSSAAAPSSASGGWVRPYIGSQKQAPAAATEDDPRRLITLRDALFVIEQERGHGGGRGAARGWA
ncbi:TAF4-domain-containing protein [Punctularia strigosozonata HHB-11173 SS5]|uniref:TAF4-domain-containing protein n=1 Tax=Punctularia strigosozonata (strain HHB-11173) TaxID=741275 RepID=UPI000441714A|nr:TAF4-domain-containing protein [Punctularia strigosozonata HHB-11173 SS5]EIN11022.1 TAF4-domain-containing protein [Punctularia strigosozonata HHB-11173 SS5]